MGIINLIKGFFTRTSSEIKEANKEEIVEKSKEETTLKKAHKELDDAEQILIILREMWQREEIGADFATLVHELNQHLIKLIDLLESNQELKSIKSQAIDRIKKLSLRRLNELKFLGNHPHIQEVYAHVEGLYKDFKIVSSMLDRKHYDG